MRFWNRFEKSHAVDWTRLGRRKTKGDLLTFLKEEAARFTPDDLNLMMIHYDAKIKDLPTEYRSELARYARIQITDGYNRLMTRTLESIHAKMRISPARFAASAKRECTKGTAGDRLRSLKYLIAAYVIFIENEPTHPVGMPFPGGGMVEVFDGIYYCPVKDAWTDIDDALCSFCPAQQTPNLTKEERNTAAKEEKLTNYFYNYHG
ncbi:MAG TPA: DUF2115 domain-containing protein [Methanocorpusculum sp.]|nr:DUF2115 domain-containing protein [Methanocorpusculum sp.]